jgi:hypothetical protein
MYQAFLIASETSYHVSPCVQCSLYLTDTIQSQLMGVN